MAATLVPTTKYKKDIKRLESRGLDMSLLDAAVDLIAVGSELPERYKKHDLTGDRLGQTDIHIKPDWVLLYEHDEFDGHEVIYLRRTGTHADLFD
jgi:mRNA interferase YafQ